MPFAGAGFSNNYTRQTWQAAAVSAYLARVKAELPPDSYWNSSGRAYPDVAVVGDKVPTLL